MITTLASTVEASGFLFWLVVAVLIVGLIYLLKKLGIL